MADMVFRLAGDPPLDFRAVDNGDGTFALSVSGGSGEDDTVVRLAGDPPVNFRAVSNGDGTYSLSVSGGSGGDAYTKAEVDTLLDAKADQATTYTKTEADAITDALDARIAALETGGGAG